MSFYYEDDIPIVLNLPKNASRISWDKVQSKSEKKQSLIWLSDTKLDADIEDNVVISMELVKFLGGFRLSINLYANQSLVERADYKPEGWHKNKFSDKKKISEGHKHKVRDDVKGRDGVQDSHAFKPKDVSDWTDPLQTIKDVLKEWNINIDEIIDIPNEFWQSDVNEFM